MATGEGQISQVFTIHLQFVMTAMMTLLPLINLAAQRLIKIMKTVKMQNLTDLLLEKW